MSAQPHEHGSLGQEAARLAEAFGAWAASSPAAAPLRDGDWLGRAAAAAASGPPAEEGSPECRSCPVCQMMRLVRGLRPEVFEHLSVASAALVAAVRAALEPADPARAPEVADDPAPGPPPGPTSQRIDIR